MDLICKGCKANLVFAQKLSLEVRNGILIIKCPICNYYTNVTITEEGMVKGVEDKNDSPDGK